MFSSNYHNVSIGGYLWLNRYIQEYKLWDVKSKYGIAIFKDCFMIVRKKDLTIVESESEFLINDAQKIIKEVDDMFEIYINIDKLANLYPPIKDEIMSHLYQLIVLDGNRIK